MMSYYHIYYHLRKAWYIDGDFDRLVVSYLF